MVIWYGRPGSMKATMDKYLYFSSLAIVIGIDSGIEDEITYAGGHLTCLLNCIVGWTNVSKELRQRVIHEGFLFSHIEQLAQLSSDGENEVCFNACYNILVMIAVALWLYLT